MNENLDLTKILEGCPKGTEFYSIDYGTVYFDSITEHEKYPISFRKGFGIYVFAKDGRVYTEFDGECVIFPSKEQRDWSKFERFWDKPKKEKFDPKALQPFDKVLVRDGLFTHWQIDFFGYINSRKKLVGCSTYWNIGIPYNEETKHLLGTIDDCPEYYKWWEE